MELSCVLMRNNLVDCADISKKNLYNEFCEQLEYQIELIDLNSIRK